MNRKIVVLFLLMLAASASLRAQLSATAWGKDDMEQFFKTKTCFVTTANKQLNGEVMAGIKQFWKHTPIDSISEEEFSKRISDPSYSFMMIIMIEVITEKRNAQGAVVSKYSDYNHLFGIINGGKKKIEKFVYQDMVAYCPLNYAMDEKPTYNCGYRGQSLVYNLHEAINIVKEKQLKGNSYKLVKQLQDIYNVKAPRIKSKTLLVNKDHLKDISEEEFKKEYPHKVEFCDAEKFQKAYKEKDPNYVIFQPTVTINKSICVYDAATYECLYFGDDPVHLKMKKGDIKDLAKAVGGK
jgi:hypothetical protein